MNKSNIVTGSKCASEPVKKTDIDYCILVFHVDTPIKYDYKFTGKCNNQSNYCTH